MTQANQALHPTLAGAITAGAGERDRWPVQTAIAARTHNQEDGDEVHD